ncbi:hypothetical protein SFR_7089 (plasmid) [Streptomyces sp. FR-008]|nr:hypothetical protein SFR_7089 [Streptomyces sp. FR-008]
MGFLSSTMTNLARLEGVRQEAGPGGSLAGPCCHVAHQWALPP